MPQAGPVPGAAAALEARGIPVEVVGLGGLLTVPEVADIVATLRVLHDPGASDAAGPAAHRPALADRPARPGGAGQAGPGAGPRARRSADRPGTGRRTGRRHRTRPADEDPLAKAITDLTADPGSLVEALDDLGDPAGYSAAGHARLAALAAELRELRSRVARPLPDLVGEVERALGLDIEVAARPGRDMASARADLDAFADAAAAFAGDQEEPTLGAFLAYLTAAEEEEFGLESGRVGDGDTVTLATVHASKGLQWAAVVVPGLSAGKKAQVFPAKPRFASRWTENARLLPFGLRGDAGDLPALPSLEPGALAAFGAACAARDLGEERRLAYVATTRAAFWLACTGYWWGDASSPLGPSVFLEEVRAACEAGAGTVACWAAAAGGGRENPALAEPPSATWPAEPRGRQQERSGKPRSWCMRPWRATARKARRPGRPRAPGCWRARGRCAERGGPGAGGGLGHRDRAAAGRAGRVARRGRVSGLAAATAVRVRAGHDGPRPGRAGPADPPADAAAARAAGPPGHRFPPLAGGAVQPAAPDRPGRPARRRRRPGRG